MAHRVKMLLVDVYGEGKVSEVTVEVKTSEFCRLLGTDNLELEFYWIGALEFAIFCDGDGRERSDARDSLFHGTEVMLAGNLLIGAVDEEAEFRNLQPYEIRHIRNRLFSLGRLRPGGGSEHWPAIRDADYCGPNGEQT